MEIKEIPISKINGFVFELRSETKNNDPDLLNSIKKQGLLQPILLRPNKKGSGYQLVAGSRRLAVFKKLGRKTIPSVIHHLDDKTAFEVALTENVQKRSLSEVEEAKAFRKYLDEYNESIRNLADKIGKGKHYVVQRLFLIDWTKELPPSVKKEIEKEISPSGSLSMGHVETLSKLRDTDKVKEIARAVKEEKLTTEQTSQVVNYVQDRDMPVARAVQTVKVVERAREAASDVVEQLQEAVVESSKQIKEIESSKQRKLMEDYIFLGTIIQSLQDGRVFCPDDDSDMLLWNRCKTPISETHTKLKTQLGIGK